MSNVTIKITSTENDRRVSQKTCSFAMNANEIISTMLLSFQHFCLFICISYRKLGWRAISKVALLLLSNKLKAHRRQRDSYFPCQQQQHAHIFYLKTHISVPLFVNRIFSWLFFHSRLRCADPHFLLPIIAIMMFAFLKKKKKASNERKISQIVHWIIGLPQ